MNFFYKYIVWAPQLAGWIVYIVTNSMLVLSIVCIIEAILYIIVEFYKLSFGQRKIDTSKGLPRLLFGKNSALKQSGVFFEESIINAKGSKKIVAWFVFLLSIAYVIFFIVIRFINVK
jgi:hypothetical protein